MKIAVFGAGAIGGYIGAKLALAGVDVTLIARGPHLEAMRTQGLRLIEGETDRVSHPRAIADARDAGPQDYLIVALKAHQIAGALDAMAPLIGPDTSLVMAQNGVPWWYFYKHGGPFEDRRVEAVDPGGVIWDTLRPERVIGCVVYPSCEIIAPGVIRHIEDQRFSLGEPDGSRSDRVVRLAEVLNGSGLRAPVRSRLRNEIWLKLIGNVALNPVSALTRTTLDVICADPPVRRFVRDVMLEAEAVAGALGETLRVSVDARLDGAAAVGAHKTSMLQDLEAGRPLELDAIAGAVVEIARMTQVATPNLDALHGLSRLLASGMSVPASGRGASPA